MNKTFLLPASAAIVVACIMSSAPAYAAGIPVSVPGVVGVNVDPNSSGSNVTANVGGTTTGTNVATANVGTTSSGTTVTATVGTTTVNGNVNGTNTNVSVGTNTTGTTGTTGTATVSQSPTSSTTPSTPTPTSTTETPTQDSTPSAPVTTPTTPPTATSTVLDMLLVDGSSASVYPVKDGYQDSVTFKIQALNAFAQQVNIRGKAVLSRGSKIVKTWSLNGTTAALTWDGRVGKAIKTGLYTLKVTAWSPDGTTKSATENVRVYGDHLQQATAVVKSKVGTHATVAKMPAAVAKAFSKGKVTIRIRTNAIVVGHAKLVFQNKNAKRTLVLRNGVHTTGSMVVPQGFKTVKIKHVWKKGTAKLLSVSAIWTYEKLVK